MINQNTTPFSPHSPTAAPTPNHPRFPSPASHHTEPLHGLAHNPPILTQPTHTPHKQQTPTAPPNTTQPPPGHHHHTTSHTAATIPHKHPTTANNEQQSKTCHQKHRPKIPIATFKPRTKNGLQLGCFGKRACPLCPIHELFTEIAATMNSRMW